MAQKQKLTFPIEGNKTLEQRFTGKDVGKAVFITMASGEKKSFTKVGDKELERGGVTYKILFKKEKKKDKKKPDKKKEKTSKDKKSKKDKKKNKKKKK